jgi:hypothetical protein
MLIQKEHVQSFRQGVAFGYEAKSEI